jgi:hypothetical protein
MAQPTDCKSQKANLKNNNLKQKNTAGDKCSEITSNSLNYAMNTLSVKYYKTIKHDSSHITYQVFPSTQQVLWKGSEAGMEALHLEPATCLGAPATCQHIPDSSHAPVNTTQ